MHPISEKRYKTKALSDKNTYATILLGIVLQQYGKDVFEWYPQTLRKEIIEDFGIKIPSVNISKIYSAILYLKEIDQFHNFIQPHNDIIMGINGYLMNENFWIPPTVEDILWGAFETLLLQPPDSPDQKREGSRFSYEINYYVCKTLANENYTRLPALFHQVGYESIPEVFKDINYESMNELNVGLFNIDRLEMDLSINFGAKLADYVYQIDQSKYFPGHKDTSELLLRHLHKYIEPLISSSPAEDNKNEQQIHPDQRGTNEVLTG